MTLPATERRAGPFNGNGVATTFSFTFKAFTTEEVLVVVAIDGAETLLSSNYSVSLNVDQTVNPGGTVTYPVSGPPLAVGQQLSILSGVSYAQTLALPQGGNYNPAALEQGLDRIVMQVQQLQEQLARAIKVPPNTNINQEFVDSATVRAGKGLVFDSAGNIVVASPYAPGVLNVSAFAETLLDDTTPAAARATLGVATPSAFGAAWAQLADAPAARAALDVSQATLDPVFVSLNGGPLGGALRNFIMNPLWVVRERFGASTQVTLNNAGSGSYLFDGWAGMCVGPGELTAERVTTNGPSAAFPFSGRLTVNTADTSGVATSIISLEHRLDLASLPARAALTGTPMTLSFWVKSSKTGVHCVYFQNYTRAYSQVQTFSVNMANAWEYKTITLSNGLSPLLLMDAVAGTALRIGFTLLAGVNFRTSSIGSVLSGDLRASTEQVNVADAVNNGFSLGPIQFERGTVASLFEQAPPWLMRNWVATRAQRLEPKAGSGNWLLGIGRAASTTAVRLFVPFPCGVDLAPSTVDRSYSTSGTFTANASSISGFTFYAGGRGSSGGFSIEGATTGLTAGQAVEVFGASSSSFTFFVDHP